MILVYLTCKDDIEAIKIGNALLIAKLIACARRTKVSSSYWWDKKINSHDEILLTMESVENKFENIEKIIRKMHSYDTFVLTATTVSKTTVEVEKWLKDAIK